MNLDFDLVRKAFEQSPTTVGELGFTILELSQGSVTKAELSEMLLRLILSGLDHLEQYSHPEENLPNIIEQASEIGAKTINERIVQSTPVEQKIDAQIERASPYQAAIYDWVRNGTGNLLINAVAGSGKTTTLVKAMEYMQGRVLFLAFNRHIRDELVKRVPPGIQVKTLNAFGWEICRANVRDVKLDTFKDKNYLDAIVSCSQEPERYARLRNPIFKMIGLLKALGHTDTTHWEDIANEYGVEFGDLKDADKFPNVLKVVYKWSIDDTLKMSFDDQIFQPVYRDWQVPKYDWVLIDEGQDCSPVQVELADRLHQRGARIMVVGDPDQSIYLFRGAHPDAMASMATRLAAVELPLSVCYRCPDSIAELARQEVPRLESPNPNPKGIGTIVDCTTEEFEKQVRAGDFVICRTTAPLVKRCLRALARGQKAYVKGREISEKLIELIEKVHGNPKTLKRQYTVGPTIPDVNDFLVRLRGYVDEQKKRYEEKGREIEADALEDRCMCIEYLAEEVDFVIMIIKKIEQIFSDDLQPGITFMTGHKAKGLEGARIWWLRPDQCPSPLAKIRAQQKQEKNLIYVIKTRSTNFLGIVEKEQDER